VEDEVEQTRDGVAVEGEAGRISGEGCGNVGNCEFFEVIQLEDLRRDVNSLEWVNRQSEKGQYTITYKLYSCSRVVKLCECLQSFGGDLVLHATVAQATLVLLVSRIHETAFCL
jgi:hypothetical protein